MDDCMVKTKTRNSYNDYKDVLFKIRDIYTSKEVSALKQEELFKRLLESENLNKTYSLSN